MFPAGTTTLPIFRASTMSSGFRLYSSSLRGSTLTMIDRMFGPNGEIATVPGTFFCTIGRMMFCARSPIAPIEVFSPSLTKTR